MPSFSIALTGLQADSTALNNIGNNLANLNTTAFKKQDTAFEDLFYQNIGGSGSGDTLEEGTGVRVATTQTRFAQGSLATTTTSTDVALNGEGFFVVQSPSAQSLTRAGDFQLDKFGNLITSDGLSVMGFGAVNGTVTPTGTLSPLALPLEGHGSSKATSTFSLTGNLDASSAVGTSYNTTIPIYDSLGESHTANITFTKSAANTWGYTIALPPADATGTPVNNTGTLVFNSSGVLTSPSTNPTGITFPGMTDGAADLSFGWGLIGTAGVPTISQSVSTSTTNASTQDGYGSGTYQSFSIDNQGIVSAKFSNGQVAIVGQLAVASVANVEGLTRAGGNNYQTNNASGNASFAAAGVGSRGVIEDNALEQSNVDISTEFSDLIIAQRAFQANTKTVTTFDAVTQDAIAMLR